MTGQDGLDALHRHKTVGICLHHDRLVIGGVGVLVTRKHYRTPHDGLIAISRPVRPVRRIEPLCLKVKHDIDPVARPPCARNIKIPPLHDIGYSPPVDTHRRMLAPCRDAQGNGELLLARRLYCKTPSAFVKQVAFSDKAHCFAGRRPGRSRSRIVEVYNRAVPSLHYGDKRNVCKPHRAV